MILTHLRLYDDYDEDQWNKIIAVTDHWTRVNWIPSLEKLGPEISPEFWTYTCLRKFGK